MVLFSTLAANVTVMASKDTFFSKKTTLNCRGKLLDLSVPKVMGILNVTPDSFYDGGRYVMDDTIKGRIDQLFSEGADIIDVGAYSSRPGALEVTPEEEKGRLRPALEHIRRQYPDAIISLDTFRAEVAGMAVSDYETDIVNDITAGLADPVMLETVARYDVPFVMMHMQGTPATMQLNPVYENVVKDIITFFAERLHQASTFGIKDIIIDPGFGFGKTIRHNFQLLHGLSAFSIFELPVMAGLSRKSMIHKSLGITPEESLNGTTVLNTLALMNGASLLRVHDVKEAREVVKLFLEYQGEGGEGNR
jgi:dihydropteroate synthase